MNKEEIKNILDKANISVIDEINILEYIDELEKVKEDYIKSLDKLDVLEDRIDKAIEYIEENACYEEDTKIFCDDLRYDECLKLLDILRGEDENNSI